jgi:hypothetical protein
VLANNAVKRCPLGFAALVAKRRTGRATVHCRLRRCGRGHLARQIILRAKVIPRGCAKKCEEDWRTTGVRISYTVRYPDSQSSVTDAQIRDKTCQPSLARRLLVLRGYWASHAGEVY